MEKEKIFTGIKRCSDSELINFHAKLNHIISNLWYQSLESSKLPIEYNEAKDIMVKIEIEMSYRGIKNICY